MRRRVMTGPACTGVNRNTLHFGVCMRVIETSKQQVESLEGNGFLNKLKASPSLF